MVQVNSLAVIMKHMQPITCFCVIVDTSSIFGSALFGVKVTKVVLGGV